MSELEDSEVYKLRTKGGKRDPVKNWALPKKVFFACGACHILAYAFLDAYPDTITIMIASTHRSRALFVPASLVLAVSVIPSAGRAQASRRGTLRHPIIDSRMTREEAFDGLDPKCPAEIRRRQRLITVKYYSTDNQVHQGQLVIDAELVGDIKRVFALALLERFPIHSVIPVSDQRFRKENRWDDELSTNAIWHAALQGSSRPIPLPSL